MLNPKVSPLVFPRLLLTGAAGQLGRELRPRLKAYCDVLRVSDQNDLGMAAVGEEIQTADLANASDMQTLLKDVNAVVHLGGVSTEQPWAPILASNIVGMVNLYEAARLQGTKHVGYRALDSSDVLDTQSKQGRTFPRRCFCQNRTSRRISTAVRSSLLKPRKTSLTVRNIDKYQQYQ